MRWIVGWLTPSAPAMARSEWPSWRRASRMARKTPFPGGESSDTTPAETEASLSLWRGDSDRARRPIGTGCNRIGILFHHAGEDDAGRGLRLRLGARPLVAPSRAH